MFSLSSSHHFYLYNGPTDMRKSFDGLCGIIQHHVGRNPLAGDVFIFVNRRRDRLKLLHWERGGFVLYYKRLEKGTLELPVSNSANISFEIEWSCLVMMVEGISYEKTKKRKRYLHEIY